MNIPSILLKQSFLSTIVALVRISMSFFTNKILAVVLGPASFAMIAQFQNLMMAAHAGGSLALQNGWVSLTAQHKEDEGKRLALWRSGLILSAVGMLVVTLLLLIASFTGVFEFLFPTVAPMTLRIALLLAIPGMIAMVVISIVQSVANGFSAFRLWAALSMAAIVVQGLWVIVFVLWKSEFVFIALATQSILALIASLILCSNKKIPWQVLRAPSLGFSVWKKFAWMGIIPMILSPIILTSVRSILGESLGWHAAGLWQGAFRISDFFNVAISSVLGVLLLPKLSKLKNEIAFFKTLWSALVVVLLIAFGLIAIMIIVREPIVRLVLSEKFIGVENKLPIQWVGDFFRCGSWCLGFGLIVKQAAKTFLALEVLSQSLFFVLCYIGISFVGISAPFWAYAIENLVSFTLILFITLRNYFLWKKHH